MRLSSLAGILWLLGFFLNCTLLSILFLRRRAKRFPVFFTFIGLGVIRTLVLFCLFRRSEWHLYKTTYWIFITLDTCLQLALIAEIASKVFRRSGRWVADVKRSLVFWSIVSLVIAFTLTALQHTAGRGWVQDSILRGNFFPSVLICELFVVMLVLSSQAGLNWRSHVAGIAIGLVAFNFPSIVIDTIDNLRGFNAQGYLAAGLENARKELYLACIIYWCYSMWRDEPKTSIMSSHMEGQVSALRDAVVQRNSNWSER